MHEVDTAVFLLKASRHTSLTFLASACLNPLLKWEYLPIGWNSVYLWEGDDDGWQWVRRDWCGLRTMRGTTFPIITKLWFCQWGMGNKCSQKSMLHLGGLKCKTLGMESKWFTMIHKVFLKD